MNDQIKIPKILYDAILKYLDSKPASQECRKLARMLRENSEGMDA